MKQETFKEYISALLYSVWPEETEWKFLSSSLSDMLLEDPKGIREILVDTGFTFEESLEPGQLQSPFSFLKSDNRVGREQKDFYVTATQIPFQLGEGGFEAISYLFPSEESGFDDLLKELQGALKIFNIETYQKGGKVDYYLAADALLSLFHIYLGAYPAGEQGVSLYECARLNAAVVVSQILSQSDVQSSDSDKLLFVKGDLSGIQDYIFDVVSKGAAKSLKARSFRVQAMSMMAVDYLLGEYGLSPANVLYNGGEYLCCCCLDF